MSVVLTNKMTLQMAAEDTLGVLPGSPVWRPMEWNTIGQFGATVTNVARDPVSVSRQRRKGGTTDLDSAVDFETDFVFSHFIDLIEAFTFATANQASTTALGVFTPTAVVDGGGAEDEYTVAASGDLDAGILIYARGFTNSDNNGLKLVVATSSATAIKVVTASLVAEPAPPTNAEVAVAGVEGATGDIQIDANGDLIATALDLSALGLTVGQAIYVGGVAAGNQFAVAANTGYARITAIAAGKLTLDRTSATFTVDNGATKDIRIFFGRFVRNVSVDDTDFLERSYHIEAKFDSLATGSADAYQYAKGNLCNEITINLPLTDKATINYGFIGTDTDVPTTSRETNAATPIQPNRTAMLNTTADTARLRMIDVDETGLSTYFKSFSLTLLNNVTPEKVIGTLGATFMNFGNIEANIEATLLFTDDALTARVRNNTTVSIDFALENGDGGVFVDIPSLTLGDGSLDPRVNESVDISLTGMSFADETLDTSISFSFFPFIPNAS